MLLRIFLFVISTANAADWEKYVAASTNDLSRLFLIESQLLDHLDQWMYDIHIGNIQKCDSIQDDVKLVHETFSSINVSDWRRASALEYVSHPGTWAMSNLLMHIVNKRLLSNTFFQKCKPTAHLFQNVSWT